MGRAIVPSGASTGKAEAVELRDGGTAWEGRGVTRAIANIKDPIQSLLQDFDALDQRGLDDRLRAADGTANLARFGGNSTLAVSLASLRAAAVATGEPLHRHIAALAGTEPSMPLPMVNILSGGLHARRGMDIQDFLVIPLGAHSYTQALEWACRVRTAAAEICAERGITTLLADEGGLSPGFELSELALDLMMDAFQRAHLRAGEDVAIALDIASSSLVSPEGKYVFAREKHSYEPREFIELQRNWAKRFPIVSVEDGLGEDDWENWPKLTESLGHIQLIGDDLFATQSERIRRAVESRIANAVLVKVNQNGTFSGALDALLTARRARYATVISARSGESEDAFLADLAVGTGGGQIKIGSVRSSERLAKYNQLLRLEEEGLPWFGRRGLAPL
jgi:enolase